MSKFNQTFYLNGTKNLSAGFNFEWFKVLLECGLDDIKHNQELGYHSNSSGVFFYRQCSLVKG